MQPYSIDSSATTDIWGISTLTRRSHQKDRRCAEPSQPLQSQVYERRVHHSFCGRARQKYDSYPLQIPKQRSIWPAKVGTTGVGAEVNTTFVMQHTRQIQVFLRWFCDNCTSICGQGSTIIIGNATVWVRDHKHFC